MKAFEQSVLLFDSSPDEIWCKSVKICCVAASEDENSNSESLNSLQFLLGFRPLDTYGCYVSPNAYRISGYLVNWKFQSATFHSDFMKQSSANRKKAVVTGHLTDDNASVDTRIIASEIRTS